MARLAAPTLIRQNDYSHIIAWYRETLPKVPPPKPARWEPVRIGPTWDWNPERGWLLPEHSMGWEMLGWTGYWLRDGRGQEWQWTPEQARFLLWYHALDETGRLLYRTAVLQRMKGHGKDPLACGESCAHAFAPIQFDYWGPDGQPVGRMVDQAWVQITAVSKNQTQNTMKLFPTMLGAEARRHYGIQIGRDNVWGLGDTRQIQASSSNYLAIEGNRVTEAIRNEPQNWNSSNQGHELAGAIEGNSTKIPDRAGRILDIENAYIPGADSVAERVREAWESTQSIDDRGPRARAFGMLLDSLEAHPKAPLDDYDAIPEIIETVRGDSHWLDIPTIRESILNGSNTASESRRKWYNQILTAADGWMSPQEFDPNYRDERPDPGEAIVMFGDGSKSDDHTALIGCRLSDGLVFPIGIWVPQRVKEGQREVSLPIDRGLVDRAARDALDTYDVHGFWFDPSDARDDDTGERYWEAYLDAIAKDYAHQLRRLPAVKTGMSQHLVIWDMRLPQHLKAFTEACERTRGDLVDQRMFHNCPQAGVAGASGPGVRMRQHVLNARRRPNKFGVSIGKEHRESRKKIDAAVCMVGARMMRHYLNGHDQKGRRQPGDGSITTFQW